MDADSPVNETTYPQLRENIEVLMMLLLDTGVTGTLTSNPPNDSTGVATDTGNFSTDLHNGRTLLITSGLAIGNLYTIDDTTTNTVVCTGDNLYADGVRSADTYKILYDLKVNTDGHNHNGINSAEVVLADNQITQAKLLDGAVGRLELKTSLSEFNHTAETMGSGWALMAGGEYGFSVQGKGDNANMQFAYGMTIGTLGADGGMISASFVGPMIQWTWRRTDGSAAHHLYLQQRYVTSSGEINWFFIVRDPVTKKISHRWFAPDHPCFGNGGIPETVPHPWIFNRNIDGEIVVVQITPDELDKMMAEHEDCESVLEMLTHHYEINEKSKPKWSSKEITVGLPKGRDWRNEPTGTKVTPIKMAIPKPKNIIHKSLKKRGT